MTKKPEISEHVETNDLGQVKIASSAKAGKWVWVNAKQYRGILKRRITRLKWEQTRKKQSKKKVLEPFTKSTQTSLLYKHVATRSLEENSLVVLPYIVPHPHLSPSHLISM